MGLCHGKASTEVAKQEENKNSIGIIETNNNDCGDNECKPQPFVAESPSVDGISSKPSPFPFYSPSPANNSNMSFFNSPANSTPRRFFKRPFPPPSPAKHINAVLARRHGSVKPNEASIPEGSESEVVLDKSFGFSKNFPAKYDLGYEVGRGHFGHTCFAKCRKGELKGQSVAVKVICKAKMTTAIAIEDVRREVKILRALTGHSNLVKFHDAYEDSANVYIAMEHKRLGDAKDPIAVRKVQKADREKLRRDRLNEQFAELGTTLDPDRPKNDKATVLGDTIQMLKDLTAEVKRLKCEEKSLVEESRDLTQEKNELRDEKTVLKAEIDQLRSQFEQRVQTMFSWSAMDPTLMVGATPFPYSMAIPHPGTTTVSDSRSAPLQGHTQAPLMPAPFVPVPVPPGTIPMHSPFQAYPFFGPRNSEGSNPYIAFPPYSSTMNTHTHVERPSAQYPSHIQPLPGYLVQLQLSQGNRPGFAQPQSTIGVSQSIDAPTSARASDETSENNEGDKSAASNESINHGNKNGHKPSPSHSSSRSAHMDSRLLDLQLKIQGSIPTDSHLESNHSSHGSLEHEHIQEASSEVKKGKNSSHNRKPVLLGLQLGEKSCSGRSSPCKCLGDVSSSSFGSEHSIKSNNSRSPSKEM